MKKFSAFFLALFLAFSVPTIPVVPAQMSAPVSAPVSAPATVSPVPAAVVAPAFDRVGVVAAAGGKVELTTFGQAGRTAQSGQPIFMGDEVKTDAAGHLQILLLDETVFTIGPDSTLTIDKFVYDPKSHNGEIKASITQGVFRYVSGKIAAKNPDSVKVKLPTASLGFRGTIVGGSVGANGQGLAALLGPGKNNDAGVRNGNFTIDGDGGDHQDVNRTGFGVEVGADGGVSGVFQLSDAQINGLTQGLGGGQGGGGQQGGGGDSGGGLGGNTDMGALSGENKAVTGDNVTLVGGLNNVSDSMNNVSTLGAQNAANDNGGAVPKGTTTYEQLRAASGQGYYYGTANYNVTLNGLTARLEIVFGPGGTIGEGSSDVYITDGAYTDNTTSGSSGSKTFSGSGPASFHWNENVSSGATFDVTVTLTNSEGQTAHQATVVVNYNNNSVSSLPSSQTGVTTSGTFTPT